MFITRNRYEAEKRAATELLSAGNHLTNAILRHSPQGLFFLDANDNVLLTVSSCLVSLFRRQDFKNLSFEQLLTPLVTAKALNMARNHLASLRTMTHFGTAEESNPLQNVEVRLANPDGSFETGYYAFDFYALDSPPQAGMWLVRVTDVTARVQTTRELDDLRAQNQTQSEILREVLQMGRARFAAFLQRTDGTMKTIAAILKKPARSTIAFRNKLEETLDEVDRVRRDGAALKLTALQNAAQQFEDALHELRSRSSLSGNEFLPLAVKLDELFSQFTLVRSLSMAVGAAKEHALASIDPPAVTQERNAAAPLGSLENTLASLANHIAQEHQKLVALECAGLTEAPSNYQATIKNTAIQMIRNSIVHGIETPERRREIGKPEQGTMRLEFKKLPDGSFELLFRDDGCGLDPAQIRQIAIAKGLIAEHAAAELRDRQAIKLIFQAGFSTLENSPGAVARGTGMSLVRRYVHEANGRIALASLLGHDTRFRVSLPAVATRQAQVA